LLRKMAKELREKEDTATHPQRLFALFMCLFSTFYLKKLSACRLNRLLTLQKERRHCSTAPILVVVRSICGSAAARLLGSQARIPLKAQMFFSFVYSALLRYRPYWVYACIILCGLQASTLKQRRAKLGCIATEFGVTWYSNCVRYWVANTNNSTVFTTFVTPEATAPGHRSTTILW
jgi:hypothetical protein